MEGALFLEKILCTVNGQLFLFDGAVSHPLTAEAIETYKKNVKAIKERREWKTTGKGAQFMGLLTQPEEAETANIASGMWMDSQNIIYIANIDNGTAIHIKNITDPSIPEKMILRKTDISVQDLHCLKGSGKIAVSFQSGGNEWDIAVVNAETSAFTPLTEGDSIDRNPFFLDENTIYFDSRGISYNHVHAPIGLGPSHIMLLDRKNGTIIDIAADDKYDYVKPVIAQDGTLYYIRRPYQQGTHQSMSFVDVLLIPFRLLSAIFNWLNFFTVRYTGESLKSGGDNPSKTKTKTEKEIFIEGNLINVDKTMKQNAKIGDAFAGIAPSDWVLMKISPGKREQIIRKGVIDFALNESDTVFYSNCKYILRLETDGTVKAIDKIDLANNLSVL